MSEIQQTGIGTDLWMPVAGDSAAGKTAVPSTQTRLAGTADAQQAKVATAFANVCVKVASQCTMTGTLVVLALVLLAFALSIPYIERLSTRILAPLNTGTPRVSFHVGPWKVTFGDCVFTGNTDGAPLVREGSCPDQIGSLDLEGRNITAIPVTAFQGMGNMT